MTTFTAIVTTHDNPNGLRRTLGYLRYQTRPADETVVLSSDTAVPELMRLREEFPEASFFTVENRNDWGHEKRAQGIDLAGCEWLGFFNDDDMYDRRYIELMLAAAVNGADAVWCGWTGVHGNPEPAFRFGQSTSGNFIVKTRLARDAGYTARDYAADGQFIDRVARLARRAVFVPETLYHHNQEAA